MRTTKILLLILSTLTIMTMGVNAETLNLYEKVPQSQPGPWALRAGNNAVLTYNLVGDRFIGSVIGTVPLANTAYKLIYYPDPWPGAGGLSLGEGSSDSSRNIEIRFSADTGSLPKSGDGNYPNGAKFWLVKSSDYGDNRMTSWSPTVYLFEEEGGLNYIKGPIQQNSGLIADVVLSIDKTYADSIGEITVPVQMDSVNNQVGSIQFDVNITNENAALANAVRIIDVTTSTGAELVKNIDPLGKSVKIAMAKADGISDGDIADIRIGINTDRSIYSGLTLSNIISTSSDPRQNLDEAGDNGGIIVFIGDTNKDHRYTTSDALKYLRVAVGLEYGRLDDVTCDRRITAADALAVLRKAVGQDVPLGGCD